MKVLILKIDWFIRAAKIFDVLTNGIICAPKWKVNIKSRERNPLKVFVRRMSSSLELEFLCENIENLIQEILPLKVSFMLIDSIVESQGEICFKIKL